MTTIQKTVIATAFVAAIGTGVFETHQNSKLQNQIQTLQQQQAPLAAQIQELQRERDDATNQLAGLLAENARLKSNPNSNETELLKLRGEVAQLKRAEAQNDNDPAAVAAKNLVMRINQLKQYLDEHPDLKIPELQFLKDRDWLRDVASVGYNLQTDADYRRALGSLRQSAKNAFTYFLADALANYLAANNGQLPMDASELKPYFNSPIDDAVLKRYQVIQTGNISDLPKDEPIFAEKTPVDDQYDTLYKIGAFSYSEKSVGNELGTGSGWFGTNITMKLKPFVKQ